MSRFTKDNLRKIFPSTPAATLVAWVDPLNHTVEHFDISTVARAAAFIAQVGHESGGLTVIRENLNYSQSGLMKTFGKYFPSEAMAGKYARKAELIASRVYANRMGNGDEASKDGWTYRGRGLIQITGKFNYAAFAANMKMDISKVPEYLETQEGAAMSAGWFWSANGLNALADATRFTDITKRINGGTNGLVDRKEIWGRARAAL
jgi:putative chitinase